MRIACFGQAPFGRDVLVRLIEAGHEIVAVYAPPAQGRNEPPAKARNEPPAKARPDPLAEEAEKRGLRLIRHAAMRRKGVAIPERVAEYRALGAELNVLAFVTMILPPEVVDAPAHGSLCFHPSLLPKYRGGNALAWQILLGETETGVTVFRPDAGVDTGPIVVQKGGVAIEPHHTAASLYFEQLYARGVEAMVEAVAGVANGTAKAVPQDESLASFQGLVDDAVARLDWSKSALELDRWIRGCDPNPGAHTTWKGQTVRLFGARLASQGESDAPPGTVLDAGAGGICIAARGGVLDVAKLRVGDGAKQPAAEAGLALGDRLG
jgi:methionyl-tRNA formyltransferase